MVHRKGVERANNSSHEHEGQYTPEEQRFEAFAILELTPVQDSCCLWCLLVIMPTFRALLNDAITVPSRETNQIS